MVNLGRLIAEGWGVGQMILVYLLLLVGDFFLSGLAVFGGLGLAKGRRSSPSTVLFCAGAWFVSAVSFSIWMWPYVLRGHSKDANFAPRVLFYALIIIAAPYVALTMVRRREPEWPVRAHLIGWIVGGMVSGGAYLVVVLVARH